MSFTRCGRGLLDRFQLVLRSFLQKEGLPFADVLPEEKIRQAFEEEGLDFACDDDERVYTPPECRWRSRSENLTEGTAGMHTGGKSAVGPVPTGRSDDDQTRGR